MIKLVEVKKISDFNINEQKNTTSYELDEIWINPSSIFQVKTDEAMKYNLSNGYLPKAMDKRQEFSRVHYGVGNNVASVVVVGNASVIAEKLGKATRPKVLKG